MRVGFNKWWFLPFGIFVASALVASSIAVFEPAFINRSLVGVIQPTSNGVATVECSGASENDYACYQERYQSLVRGAGVEVAFTELKDEYTKNEFVKVQCHQITHVIGRAAATLYGDVPNTFSQGDSFCWSGYYHGAMETIVAKTGPDEIVEEINTLSDDLDEQQKRSFDHYNMVHGLGHGFMGTLQNELFESLETCDALGDKWERESCYSGVFVENVMALSNPSNPSKYLKVDQPLYPCTDVEAKYKDECYKMQTSYALHTQDYDFAKVFDLCGGVEDDYRPTCYESLGRDASGRSVSDVDKTKALCMLGEDDEARSNCIEGAVMDFVSYYSDDRQAKELCDSLDADLRTECLETAKEYFKIFNA